jgi:hypothetical protein
VLKSSFVKWNQFAGENVPPRESLLALSFPLAEVITELKQKPGGQPHVQALNETYDALRRSADNGRRKSAAKEFAEALEKACREHFELTPRCADLQSHLDEVLRQYRLT